MLSFGALPPVKVNLTSSYNRITASTYDLLQCFELPCESGTVGVAMALGGPCQESKENDCRLEVKFEQVRLLPAEGADRNAFIAALEAAGLGSEGVETPVQIEAKPTYIDVDHLSDALRVHKGASGATYVLRRVEDIPYTM